MTACAADAPMRCRPRPPRNREGDTLLRLGLSVAAVVLLLDQISKQWIVEGVMRPEGVTETPFFTPERIEVTPFFNLVMTWNRGISFGLFNTGAPYNTIALSALALVIVGGLVWWMKSAETRFLRLSIGLVIGGALGNLIDRIRWGAVADFLDFHAFGWHFWAFNVADAAISVGAALLVLDALFGKGDSRKNTDP